ncbi:PQQ-dependent sugar dehydrogenase [Flavobacterium caeni]|uniref:Por secretion system C-terminal sorting domain-containing protein n=1 Tax=Flavobacterium caeni TaxID=490189 RepID=A0A1G5E9D4_9FLAO|nr:PQQ-dependent sugar dehydrogenase [Flavobacterium caeni]SCY23371.1 Por secretion system C-terminal sorting domain-containing protein [Flavobacterium caeni]
MKTKITLLLFALSVSSVAQTIAIPEFATGLSGPVAIAHAGDSRLFVVQQSGAIRILNADGTVKPNNFLTLTTSTISTGGERGLLGLAFHPEYATNGYFFVNYTRSGDGATVVARYSVDPNNPDLALTTGTPFITIAQPFSNHNGGTIKFGPDGYLYIGMGDGGSGGDPGNRAQNINDNLGKMLRIDVDTPNGNIPYSNPADNPFVNADGNDEIWATGLRNPWKFSFDRGNGDLWIADVGQNAIEEINHVTSTTAGLNYGWKCYEGNAVYSPGCANPNVTYTFPVATYSHSGGACSVTGGYRYTGTTYPNMQDKYFFADLCLNRIGMVNVNTNAITYSANFSTGNPNNPGFSWTSLGEDMNGELYIASAALGKIYRITDTSLAVDQFATTTMEIKPNPSDSEFFVKIASANYPVHIKIVDASGKVVHDQQIESEFTAIPTGPLAGGIYLVNATDNRGGKTTSKLGITH